MFRNLDSDGDGISDWTFIVDHRLSTVLYPNDQDIDGDGVENTLDPRPFEFDQPIKKVTHSNDTPAWPPKKIPEHLRMTDSRSHLQKKLFLQHQILAIDQSDRHSSWVLDNLILILENALPHKWHINNLRFVYASLEHDSEVNLAFYSPHLKAMSVGGKSSYDSSTNTRADRINLLFTLAHEIGHAYVLDKMRPHDLWQWGIQFAFSKKIDHSPAQIHSFYAGPLMTSLDQIILKDSSKTNILLKNLVSSYSKTNIHEWFADAFAYILLNHLASKKLIPLNWFKVLAERNSSERMPPLKSDFLNKLAMTINPQIKNDKFSLQKFDINFTRPPGPKR